MAAAASPEYQVVLDAFRGPLDLLLYLVKREEVDVRDIPVARVADQFKAYLDVLTLIDVERAGDFLVLAATLMEIKSRLLLPPPRRRLRPWRIRAGNSSSSWYSTSASRTLRPCWNPRGRGTPCAWRVSPRRRPPPTRRNACSRSNCGTSSARSDGSCARR